MANGVWNNGTLVTQIQLFQQRRALRQERGDDDAGGGDMREAACLPLANSLGVFDPRAMATHRSASAHLPYCELHERWRDKREVSALASASNSPPQLKDVLKRVAGGAIAITLQAATSKQR